MRSRISARHAHQRLGHRPVVVGLGVAVAMMSLCVAPANAASVAGGFDICSALRGGSGLATVEAKLEARGYSPRAAGTFTGVTIRQRCPDLAAPVLARLRRTNG